MAASRVKASPKRDARGLTPEHRAFIDEYLVDLNAAAAVARIGMKGSDTARKQRGYQILRIPRVQAAIDAALVARSERVGITADRVLEELGHAALFDLKDLYAADGSLLPVHAMPEAARRAIASIETEELFEGLGKDRKWVGYVRKVKLVSKEGTLTLLGKHLKMFTDKVEVDVTESACDLILRAAGVVK